MEVGVLLPGDEVRQADGSSAVFIQHAPHPIWPNLRLVVWAMPDGSWCHDALSFRQEVGEVKRSTDEQRLARLRSALLFDERRRT